MVNVSLPGQLAATASRAGGGEDGGWGGEEAVDREMRSDPQQEALGQCPEAPERPLQAAHLAGGRWPSALDQLSGLLSPAGISAAICAQRGSP